MRSLLQVLSDLPQSLLRGHGPPSIPVAVLDERLVSPRAATGQDSVVAQPDVGTQGRLLALQCQAPLGPAELRGSPLDEGGDAFDEIRGPPKSMLQFGLELQLGFERSIDALVESLLCAGV